MKNKKINYVIIFALISVLFIASFVSYSFYCKTSKKGSGDLTVNLPAYEIEPLVIDIAKEGRVKKLLESGSITINSSFILEKSILGTEPVILKVEHEGFNENSKVIVYSSHVSFDKKTGIFKDVLASEKPISLEVMINVPKEQSSNNYKVDQGYIIFTDLKKRIQFGMVPILIINSKVQSQ